VTNNNNNDFNIIKPGPASILGWVNTDAEVVIRIFKNNLLNGQTNSTGAFTALTVNNTGTNTVSDNKINTLSAGVR
jgi:hypothetical protein